MGTNALMWMENEGNEGEARRATATPQQQQQQRHSHIASDVGARRTHTHAHTDRTHTIQIHNLLLSVPKVIKPSAGNRVYMGQCSDLFERVERNIYNQRHEIGALGPKKCSQISCLPAVSAMICP